jgi:hypothetical protein
MLFLRGGDKMVVVVLLLLLSSKKWTKQSLPHFNQKGCSAL